MPSLSTAATVHIAVTERALGPGGGAVISYENGTSDFRYNFNTAYFPAPPDGGPDGLVIRVQHTPQVGSHSGLAVVRRVGGPSSMRFEHVSESKLLIRCPGINGSSAPPTHDEPCADDPRIVYRRADRLYYMTYDNWCARRPSSPPSLR